VPELDRAPVLDWVTAYQPSLLAWVGGPMRDIEDDERVRSTLTDLGRSLEAVEAGLGLPAAMSSADAPRDFRAVLAQLGPARLLRLVCWLAAEGSPERAAVLHLLFAGLHPDAAALRAALEVLHRRELLTRLFSETRLQQLIVATRTATEGAFA